jgi:hypothetical protein
MKNIRRQLGPRQSSPKLSSHTSPRSEKGVVAKRAILAFAVISVSVQTVAWSGDGNDGGAPAVPVAAVVVAGGALRRDKPVEPFIHPAMAPNVRAKLEEGLELAAERVREIEACGDLFARLGANGIDTLNTSLYLQVDSHFREIQICGRDGAANSMGGTALAYTKVGAASTWICRSFSGVPAEMAAAIVIHEALHHAGLPEWPTDRAAMTSKEITRMINKACGF